MALGDEVNDALADSAAEEAGESTRGMTHDQRIDAITKRFEAEDRKAADKEDGLESQDEQEEEDGAGNDDSDEIEDTDSDRDGDAGESEAEDEEDSEEDTGEAESDDEADDVDDDEEEDEEEEDDEEEDGVSDETRAALERNGANLSLADVPEKYRGIVDKKLKSIDAAFTRATMQAAELRKRDREIRAEETYREQNPEMVIVDLLQKGGDALFAKVNKHLDKLNPSKEGNDEETVNDHKALLDEKREMQRRKAAEAIDAAERANEEIIQRADTVVTTAKRFATQYNVPYTRTLDRLVTAAILEKPEKERSKGLTEAEIKAVVKEHADDHNRSVRAHRREASKAVVKGRTEHRRTIKKATVRSSPSGTSSHAARKPEKIKVDHNDQESRINAMLRSAKRILPGTK